MSSSSTPSARVVGPVTADTTPIIDDEFRTLKAQGIVGVPLILTKKGNMPNTPKLINALGRFYLPPQRLPHPEPIHRRYFATMRATNNLFAALRSGKPKAASGGNVPIDWENKVVENILVAAEGGQHSAYRPVLSVTGDLLPATAVLLQKIIPEVGIKAFGYVVTADHDEEYLHKEWYWSTNAEADMAARLGIPLIDVRQMPIVAFKDGTEEDGTDKAEEEEVVAGSSEGAGSSSGGGAGLMWDGPATYPTGSRMGRHVEE